MFKSINGGKLPTRGSKHSACVDLYANTDVVIGAGETKMIGLGVCIDLDALYRQWYRITDKYKDRQSWEEFLKSHYLQLSIRSSLGKKGLMLANGIGVVDLDYTQEIKVILHNPMTPQNIDYDDYDVETESFLSYKRIRSIDSYEIKKGDKIVQCTLLKHQSCLMGIDTDEERQGGFGSTGA